MLAFALSAWGAARADLIHHYGFDDGTAKDAIGTAHGTLQGNARVADGSLVLDGAGGHLQLPAAVLGGATDFTISAWVKLDSIKSWVRVFDFGAGPGSNLFLTVRNNDNMVARFAITPAGKKSEQQLNAKTALPVGVWTHVAVTRKGGTGTLYVDGTAVATNPNMTHTPAGVGPLTRNFVGKSQYPADPTLHGRIDEIRVFNHALTPAEIVRKTFSR